VKAIKWFRDIFHKLDKNNKWLYVINEPIKIIINCQEKISEIIIEKTGVLDERRSIDLEDPGCQIRIKHSLIFSTQSMNMKDTTDFIPEFHLPNNPQIDFKKELTLWNYTNTQYK